MVTAVDVRDNGGVHGLLVARLKHPPGAPTVPVASWACLLGSQHWQHSTRQFIGKRCLLAERRRLCEQTRLTRRVGLDDDDVADLNRRGLREREVFVQ